MTCKMACLNVHFMRQSTWKDLFCLRLNDMLGRRNKASTENFFILFLPAVLWISLYRNANCLKHLDLSGGSYWFISVSYFMLISNQHYNNQQQLGNNWKCIHVHLYFICLGRIWVWECMCWYRRSRFCQINSTRKSQASAAQDGSTFTINVWINPQKTVLPTLLQWNTLMAAQKVTQRGRSKIVIYMYIKVFIITMRELTACERERRMLWAENELQRCFISWW